MTILRFLEGRTFTWKERFGSPNTPEEKAAWKRKWTAKCAVCKRERKDHMTLEHPFQKEGGKE